MEFTVKSNKGDWGNVDPSMLWTDRLHDREAATNKGDTKGVRDSLNLGRSSSYGDHTFKRLQQRPRSEA